MRPQLWGPRGACILTFMLGVLGCKPASQDPGDTGTSTDDSGTSTGETDTTGADESCGNGMLDPGEDCDDGNTEDLDACSSTCELPGATRWEDFYHGALMQRDEGWGVAIDGGGNVWVTGWETAGNNDTDILVRKYSPAGEALWTRQFNGTNVSWGEQGNAIATTADGGAIVLASDYEIANFDGSNLRLMRLDADGEPTFDVLYAGAGGRRDSAGALALDEAGGRVFVGGRQDIDDVVTSPWVGVFDLGSGQLLDERFVDDFGGGILLAVSEMALLDDGRVGLVGTTRDEIDNNSNAWVGVMTDDLQLAWEDSIDVEGGFDASSGVAAISGGLVMCATVEDPMSDDDMWIRRYSLDGQEQWTVVYDGEMSLRDSCSDVVVDDVDNITVAGRTAIAPTNPPTWSPRIAKYDGDGNLGWALDYTTNPELTTGKYFNDIAVGPDRALATVGSNSLGGEIVQVWVRVFAP